MSGATDGDRTRKLDVEIARAHAKQQMRVVVRGHEHRLAWRGRAFSDEIPDSDDTRSKDPSNIG